MKICTNIEQSKKLAEFLPIESADMSYVWDYEHMCYTPELFSFIRNQDNEGVEHIDYPCWSLAALLNIIPYAIHKSDNEFYRLGIDKGYNDYAVWYSNNGLTINDLDVISDNFVDACVAMIEKLHELNLL